MNTQPRKVRHPYQIMEVDEMVVGEDYVFITKYPTYANNHVCTFGGIFLDNSAIVKNPTHFMSPTVTVHPNGLTGSFAEICEPTIIYWGNSRNGWDDLCAFLGESEETFRGNHSIVVPKQHWEDDPKLHVTNWENPDDVIERKIGKTRNMRGDWEQQINTKRDAAMADFFGYGK